MANTTRRIRSREQGSEIFSQLAASGLSQKAYCEQHGISLRAPLKFKNNFHFYPHDFGIFQSTSSDDYFMPDFTFLSFDRPIFPVQKG